MRFPSREAAGRQLAELLVRQNVTPDLVLGLPRGGVVVAAEVSRALRCPLDVLIVRKIGHPRHREFAVGALAEPNVVLLDEASLWEFPVPRLELDAVIGEEMARLREYGSRFHRGEQPFFGEKTILIVDDGLATGATTEAAVRSIQKQAARRVMVAVPVASTIAVERLRRLADEVYALEADSNFGAVGHYYDHFEQTTDDEVMRILMENTSFNCGNPFDAVGDGG